MYCCLVSNCNLIELYMLTCSSDLTLLFFQTLFNPNQTVVKIYIVMYDLSDMPPHTQTFIRQKTLSKPSQGSGSIPALHYLIHLRSEVIL